MTTTDIAERLGRYMAPPTPRTVEVSTWVLLAAKNEIESLRRHRGELRELLHRRHERRANVRSSLTDRLRSSHREWVKGGHEALWKLANEAADEIERLRKELNGTTH